VTRKELTDQWVRTQAKCPGYHTLTLTGWEVAPNGLASYRGNMPINLATPKALAALRVALSEQQAQNAADVFALEQVCV
jgi:hypothetical protein